MNFSEWSNKKKKKEEEEKSSPSLTSDSTTKKTSSFSEWSNKKFASDINEDYINTFISDANNFFSSAKEEYKTVNWNTASSAYTNRIKTFTDLDTRADRISYWLEANKNSLDEGAYNTLSEAVSSIKKDAFSVFDSFKGVRDYYAQWETEDEYKREIMGWLNTESETTPETAAQRKEYYKSNSDRIDAIEKDLPWYAKSWLPNWAENIFLSDDKEALRNEAERLEAENNLYESMQKAMDDHYMPITDEVIQRASNRNYYNASAEELNVHDAGFRDVSKYIADGVHYLDEDGNVINSYTGKVVRPADEYSKAMLNNDTDGFYNTIIQDKLGLFLSASEDDLVEAYNRLSAGSGNVNDTWANTLRDGDVNGWKYLSEDEITIYYYKLNTEGQESAYKFLEDMTTELTRRETKKREEAINGASALEQLAMNIASIPMNVAGGTIAFGEDAIKTIRGEEINPYSRGHSWSNDASAIRNKTATDINNATGNASLPWVGTTFGDVYSALMSGADSVMASYIPGGHYLLGLNAASSAMKDVYDRGGSTTQILSEGLLFGAAEAFFEKFSIGELNKLKNMDTKSVKNLVEGFVRATIMGGVEATEEMATEIANTITDALVMGSQSNWVDFETFAKNVVNAGIGGLISGGAMGGIASAINNAQYNHQAEMHGQSVIDKGGADYLKELALEMYSDKGGYEASRGIKLASKTADNASAKNVGKLSFHLEDTVIKQNRTDIQKALVEKGLSKKDATRVAGYLGSLNDLTDAQKAEIEGNESIKAVVNELLEDSNSAISERGRNLIGARLGVDVKNSNVKASQSGKLSLRNDVDVTEKVSDTGNTTIASTGEAITIDKKNPIAKVKYVDGERVVYFNTDHGVVEASKVKYASKEEGLLYEAFVDMNPAFANAVIKNYDGSVPIQTYINGMREGMILYGMHNFQAVGKDISKNSFLASLSEADQAFALKLGRAYAKADAKKADAKLRTAIKNATEKAKTSEGASSSTATQNKPKKGKVSFEEGAKIETHKQHRRVVTLAKHLAGAIGIDIVFYDSRTTKNSHGKGANGYFDGNTDTIYLDLQNAKDDAKTIAFTLSHELVHFIKKWSPQKYAKFAEFLMEQYASHGVSASTLLRQKMAELGTTDADFAYEEMIADACETMLLDSNAVVKLMELRKSDLELFEKIKLHVLKVLNDIREAYKKLGYQPTSEEAKALLGMKDVLEKVYSLFEEAAVDATQTFQAVQSLNTESVSVSEDGTVRLQMKQYQQTGRATLLNYLREQYGNDNANDLILTIDNIYDTLKEIKNDEALSVFSHWQDTEIELDENGHPIFTTSINNGDYELNQDFSRVCKKRRQLDFVLNMLAEDPAFEASHLTKQDFVKINKAIKKHGFEIACALCFVDSKRFRQAEWADSFANTWNDILNAVVKDSSKLTPFNFATNNPNLADDGIEIDTSKAVTYRKWSDGKEDVKNRRTYESFDQMLSKGNDGKWLEGNTNVRTIATLIRDNPELRHTFRGADIIASKGFDTIQRLAPGIRSILDGWGGSSVPKPSSNDASYDSSIINMSGYNKTTAYAMGGVRMNSFSDFMAHMFFDYCQAFADLSAKELPSQAYTKELIYVRLFGRSGQKINMSGIAAIRDDALPTTASKGVTKAEAEANEKIEKMIAGLDVTRLLEHLNKDIHQLTEEDVEQFLDMCEYVWADESINMKHATLLQTGILYDKLSESKIEECYELLKAGEIEEALKVAGKDNVDTEYAKNCGTIVVGVSDAHIRKLLRDPTVRMVIPYHKSGLNPIIARELRISAYNDYTLTQTTGVKRNGSKTSDKIGSKTIKDAYGLKDFAFYDWFGKTIDGKLYDGKATADKYLEWCEKGYYDENVGDYVYYTTKGDGYILAKDFHKKASIVPKFDDFAGEENYYKVLEDFDCYNTITGEHSAQGAVDFLRNGLPSDYKDVLVGALKEEQKVHDDFRDHLDNKGLKEEVMEIVKARGYEPSIKKQLKNSETVEQKISSAKTSIAQIPALFKHKDVVFGDINIDIGGGKFDLATNFLAERGTKNYVFDPYNRSEEVNGATLAFLQNGNKADTATCANVLNVIAEEGARANVILEVAKAIKEDGTAYFMVYEGDSLGIGRETSAGWQNNRKTADYVDEISQYFESVTRKGKLIVAKNPIQNLPKATWEVSPGKGIKFQKKRNPSSYAPTFYSQMGKVIDDIKMDKIGATSLVNYLKGKGIKHDEIKWSGIEAFLEGKKSVTKAELQEFVAGSQLQIEEEMSATASYVDEDGNTYTDTEFKNKAYAIAEEQGIDRDRVKFVLDPDDGSYVAYAGSRFNGIILEAEADTSGGMIGRWSEYKLDGGSNYREIVFKMPNSTYSNRAMRGHWGEDAEGVLAHARVQDFTTADGKKMLFVEEIQSDWHNEGHSKGYTTKEYEDAVGSQDKLYNEYKKLDLAFHKYVRSNEFMTDPEDVRKKKHEWLRGKAETAQKKYLEAEKVVDSLKEQGAGDTPDAPFKDTYHEYVMKRLLRMAAEEGYDSIGWTPADIQADRWSDDYYEGYRIEYDQDIPKFLRKYGKKWGAAVGKTSLRGMKSKVTLYDVNRELKFDSVGEWKRFVKEELRNGGLSAREANQTDFMDEGEYLVAYDFNDNECDRAKITAIDNQVWSMDITEPMEQSVLYEGQPKFQKKKLSNRTILANTLESTIDTSTQDGKSELKWLKDYQDKITLIEKEEAHLAEVNAEIKEISFTKGSDRSKLKALNEEKMRTANRINTFDKQLLRFETMKPIKDVLAREKELVRKRTEEKGREALDAYREKMTKTQRELLTRYQESRKKGIESRHKTEMRHKIKDVVNELNQYLLKGTKDKHVPIELQKAVAEALDAVNMDTVGAEERIAKKREEMRIAATKGQIEKVERLAKEIEHIQEMGGNMAQKISRLKTSYDSIINSDDPLIANSHDEVISSTIDKVLEVVGETPLRDMSLYQLEAVYDMYRMILRSIQTANKAFKAEKGKEISVLANTVIADLDGKKRNRLNVADTDFAWNNLKPVYAFERIGSNTFTKLFNAVREGEDVWARDMSEAQAFREEQSKKYKFDSWDFEEKYTFYTERGKSFELDLGEMLSIYAFAKDAHSKGHLIGEGFVFDPKKEVVEKVKGKIEVKVNLEDATAYNLTEQIVADIIGKLTPDQKAFADAMQDYLSTTMGEKGNEVSLELYEIKLFKNKNYFPLKVAPQYMAVAKEKAQGDVKIKNKGFTKDRKEGAKNPIVLSSFMDVWATHVNEMSMYHAFTLPLEDFYRVFNYKTPRMEGYAPMSVNASIENAYGKAATAYIDQLLKDLNGGARSDPRETFGKAMMSNFKKASVIASLSVVIQQPSAIVRAMALVDAKYFVGKKATKGRHKAVWEEVKKYAPVAVIKEMGYFDTGMGKSSVEWLKGEKTFMDKVDDVTSKAPALADEVSWCAIWNAVKRETLHTHKNLKPNSDEFLKAVAERFTEVIVKTQVYDSTLARSANMRSKGTFMNMVTSFMAEPTTSINMLQDAFTKGKRGKYRARVLGAVYGSVILNSALVSIVYAMRDDDEDETYLEKYLSRLTTEVIDGVNPITYIPFFKDMWSIAQGFDVERADMSLVTDLIDSLQQTVKVISKDTSDMDEDELAEHKKAVAEAILSITDSLSSLVGVPVKNVRRDINGIINGFNTIKEDVNGRDTTAGSLGDTILEDVKDSVPVWGWLPDESKGDKLYDAIIKGDTAYIDRIKSGYKDDKAYQSAIRKALRENDPRIKEAAVARYNGDIAEYMRIAKEIIAEGHFKQDDIVSAINSEISAMKKGEGTTESSASNKVTSIYKVDDYYAALVGRDQATAYAVKEDLINTDVANGKDREEAEADFNSKFTSYLREEYEEGNLSDYEAQNMLVQYGGKSEEDAYSKVQYWEFKQMYPDYDLSEEAVKKYYNEVEPSGIGVDVYYDYSKQRSKCKGVDANGDGKTDSGSVKREVMQVINSLPITYAQKDALYYLNGWSASTIWEAPWH